MSPLATRLVETLRATPRHFHELVDEHPDVAWRELLRAWGELRAADILTRNEAGQYCIAALK
jgi:hypothetical protein